jgi:predicted DNA-binding transcriptional regulator AlpA
MGSKAIREHDPVDLDNRIARLAVLNAAHALSIADVALLMDLPLSTLDMMRAQGTGPKCFKLGRRLYVLQTDFREWLDTMAKVSPDH